jgi:DNA-binding beta-propeller fold protein YncE
MSKASFLFAAICFVYPVAACAQSLGIVNRSDGSFIFFDLKSEQISSVFNVGAFPHEVALDEHGTFAYIPDYGGNTVAVINLKKQKLEKHITLPGFTKLHGIAISNNIVWVTAEEQRVLVPLIGGLIPKPTLG